jgi:hypothetical protein
LQRKDKILYQNQQYTLDQQQEQKLNEQTQRLHLKTRRHCEQVHSLHQQCTHQN